MSAGVIPFFFKSLSISFPGMNTFYEFNAIIHIFHSLGKDMKYKQKCLFFRRSFLSITFMFWKKSQKFFYHSHIVGLPAESEDSLLFGIQNCGKPDTMNHKALILHLHSLFQRGISFDPLSFAACNEQYLRI